jgi:hypothetical protein
MISVAGMVQYFGPSEIYSDYTAGERYESSVVAADLSTLIGALNDHDPSAIEKNIYASSWTLASWLLRKTVRPLESGMSDDRTEYELQMYDCEYVLCEYRELDSYGVITSVGGTYLFGRLEAWDLPEILYIGRNLENYIGEVLQFDMFVRNGGQVIREYSVYVDDYSIEDLRAYDAVLLYNFKWHDYDAMQELLGAYASEGGKVVISGSGNMREDAYNLDGRSILGVTVQRKPYIRNPDIEISPLFTGEYSFSPFASEGATWYGTTYFQMEDGTFNVLASAGNNVLVAEQEYGNGAIYWLGGNIVYHAFVSYDLSERAFVKDVFLHILS